MSLDWRWYFSTTSLTCSADKDIVLLFSGKSGGAKADPEELPGIGIILNPMDFSGDAFYRTGFKDSGRSIDHADMNGDGIEDLAVSSNLGETIVFLGDGEGGFVNAGRTWTLPTVPGESFSSRVHGLTATDINRDGLAEIFVGDIGANPMSLIVWLNTSR